VINNAFLVMEFDELTEGGMAFINFSKDLLEKGIPHLLPKEKVVIEILERVEATPLIISACKRLKEEGYILSLDDYVCQESYQQIFELSDIVKIEFNSMPKEQQRTLIKANKHKIRFLAEKVETREEYLLAVEMGYELFQGYFFCKPVIMKGKEIEGPNPNLLGVVSELNQQEPKFERITGIIERDIGLSYKLLKLANSIFFAAVKKFSSINEAIVRLGVEEMRRWIYLMMIKEIRTPENNELVKLSVIRAKLMELLAIELGLKDKSFEYFLTGMFSSIDILLNKEMESIIETLSLSRDVEDALMGYHNAMRKVLNTILIHEMGNWENWDTSQLKNGNRTLSKDRFMDLYFEAILWSIEMDFSK
jgi:c-di-GMP-related signal transduction protein